ncbi:MAG: radical SAM protein [Methylococcaceae bacterium]
MLSTENHSRDSAGLKYVYPVISRRAGGLSIGINLNTNHACNWRCIYCQVPNLVRGQPEPVNLDQLRAELTSLLHECLSGDFFERHEVDTTQRIIRDIALSGNGESTVSDEFAAVMELIAEVIIDQRVPSTVNKVLITNGGGVGQDPVQAGLSTLAAMGGEVWFKLDAATTEEIRRINQVHITPDTIKHRLEIVTRLCRTRLQTCLFGEGTLKPDSALIKHYLDFLSDIKRQGIILEGVLLYGLARPSMQAEAPRLTRLPPDEIEAVAESIRQLGYEVKGSW